MVTSRGRSALTSSTRNTALACEDFLGIRGEPGGNRTPNPQIKRTTGSRPPLSTQCCRFGLYETSLLNRPPVSARIHPLVCQLVCQPATLSSRGVPSVHRHQPPQFLEPVEGLEVAMHTSAH